MLQMIWLVSRGVQVFPPIRVIRSGGSSQTRQSRSGCRQSWEGDAHHISVPSPAEFVQPKEVFKNIALATAFGMGRLIKQVYRRKRSNTL